jgi:hyperosmotically inducible protein
MLGLLIILGAGTVAADQPSTIEGIRKELLKLPYYGVFDFLAFGYDKGTVTLMGYAYRPTLTADAVRAVKRVPGVDEVVNKIEDLPPSQFDDELRWKTYYAIYGDPFLSKYAPGGGVLWGHRHAFGGTGLRPMGLGPFAAFELAGDYPIHIIVKGGRIKLLGMVDNEGDKNLAGIKANSVAGSFGVENDLTVERKTSNGTR